MACVLVPVAEAIITTVATKVLESKEKPSDARQIRLEGAAADTAEKIPFVRKMKWLNNLLWGGSALLIFEHVWHGEIVPWFPFLTAADNSAAAAEMLREMATSGIAMSALVTAVWLGMLAVSSVAEKKALKEQLAGNERSAAP